MDLTSRSYAKIVTDDGDLLPPEEEEEAGEEEPFDPQNLVRNKRERERGEVVQWKKTETKQKKTRRNEAVSEERKRDQELPACLSNDSSFSSSRSVSFSLILASSRQ